MLALKQNRFPVLYLILGEFTTLPEGLAGLGSLQSEAGFSATSPPSPDKINFCQREKAFCARAFYNCYNEKLSQSYNRAISFAKYCDFSGINTDAINFLEPLDEQVSKQLVKKFNRNGLLISVYGRHMMDKVHFGRILRTEMDQMIIDDDGPYSREGRD